MTLDKLELSELAAARNTLPALLRVVKAAQRFVDAELVYDGLTEALNDPAVHVDRQRIAATFEELRQARLELHAALADLDSS